jgi:hypothetical protein
MAKSVRFGHWFYKCKRPLKAVKFGRKALKIGKNQKWYFYSFLPFLPTSTG